MRKGYLPSDEKRYRSSNPSPWTGDGWSFDPKSITNYSSYEREAARDPRPGDLFVGQPNPYRKAASRALSRFGTSSLQTRDPITILTALFVFLIFLSPGLIALTIVMMGR